MTKILGQKRFAVLLANFTDSKNPTPFSKAQADDAWNRVSTFWEYDSYDNVGFFGSKVFDWQTYPSTLSKFQSDHAQKDKQGNVTGYDRGGMIEAVKTAFGVDKTKFEYFIVIFSEAVGTAWSSGQGAIFEPTIVNLYYLCHEMTHMLGEPDHSYDFSGRKVATWSAPGEYYDQTDLMSAGNTWSTAQVAGDPFSGAGPHHCMFWRDKFGWLDDTVIRRITDKELEQTFDETFTLFSRDEPVAERLNCIKFLDIWVELALNKDRGANNPFFDNFDTGLPRSGVLIHQRGAVGSNPVPYVLVPDLAGAPDQKFWSAGQVCRRVENSPDPGIPVYVWVQSVDVDGGSAEVNISNTFPPPLTRHRIEAIRLAHSTAGGKGGFDYILKVGVRNGSGQLVAIDRTYVVDWIVRGRNSFYVEGADGSEADVIAESHWITTVADDTTADNLLSLPRF